MASLHPSGGSEPRSRVQRGCILDWAVTGKMEHLFFRDLLLPFSAPVELGDNKAVIIYTVRWFCQWSLSLRLWKTKSNTEGVCEFSSSQEEV